MSAIDFQKSGVMMSFAKTAESKGWVKREPQIKKEASFIDLTPTDSLFADMCKLAHGLRAKGFTKQADAFEAKVVAYKVAQNNLYSNMLNAAHPDGSIDMFEAQEGLGIWNTMEDKQKKMLEMAAKQPSGNIAKIAALIKIAQAGIIDANTNLRQASSLKQRYPVFAADLEFSKFNFQAGQNREAYFSILPDRINAFDSLLRIIPLTGGSPSRAATLLPSYITSKQQAQAMNSVLGNPVQNIEQYYSGQVPGVRGILTNQQFDTPNSSRAGDNPNSVFYKNDLGQTVFDISSSGATQLISQLQTRINELYDAVVGPSAVEEFNSRVSTPVTAIRTALSKVDIPDSATDEYDNILPGISAKLQEASIAINSIKMSNGRKTISEILTMINSEKGVPEAKFWDDLTKLLRDALSAVGMETGETVRLTEGDAASIDLSSTISRWTEASRISNLPDDQRDSIREDIRNLSVIQRAISNGAAQGLSLAEIKRAMGGARNFSTEIGAITSIEGLKSFVSNLISESNRVLGGGR